MRPLTRGALAALAVLAAAFPPSAGATTIGSITATSVPNTCESASESLFLVQFASSGPSYVVPSGGGYITSWRTSFGSPGGKMDMVMLRPTGTLGEYTVVGADDETLPSPIPTNHISTFSLSSPIVVQAGDVLGLVIPALSPTACLYEAVTGDNFVDGPHGALSVGEALKANSSGEKTLLNIGAELIQSVDVSLTESITPASGGPGVALISLTPGGTWPSSIGATVTDIVPPGLKVLAAGVSGHGTCSVTGQTVTCALTSPEAGSPVPVIDIVVSSSTPGSYANQALITPALPDSKPADNTASATLTVTAPNPPVKCTVIALKGTTLSLAETALKALHCHIGKVKKVSSKTVHKGLVVSTTLKPGTSAPANASVGISVSSGKPKKRHH
jgi:hypothetical protein